jgi:OmpA-OmpF porin, OOP family
MIRLRTIFVSAAVSPLVLAAMATTAEAQVRRAPATNGTGTDTHLFRPAVDSKGFFTVNGSEVLGKGGLSLGLVIDYGHQIMRLSPGHGQDALVTHSLRGTLGASYGLFNRLILGIQAPIDVMQGKGVTDIGPAGSTYDSQTLEGQHLGFVAGHLKLHVLRSEQAIGIALIGQAGFPVSKTPARDLGAEAKPFFWPQLVLEKKFGPLRIGANGGYRFGSYGAPTVYDQLKGGRFESSNGLGTAGLAVGLRPLDQLEIIGETYATKQVGGSSAAKVSLSQEAIGGLKLFVEKNSYLMLGGGVRIGDGFQAADQRGFLGFMFEPSIGDRDGDGFRDDEDDCPDEPEDKDGFQDGYSDSPPHQLGCPDLDNDKDGIPDKLDRCPNDPEDMDGDADEDGCPEPDTRDRDKDGILDKDDKCPDVPEDKDGFEDEDGCPDPDNDRDGIPDASDACPMQAETINQYEDTDGCPDVKPPEKDKRVIVEGNTVLILEQILFEKNSAKILPASDGILEAVATTLKDHPEFDLLEVQGHADERGNPTHNLKLTKDRAASVVGALTSRGVAESRLRPMGYGKYCPVDAGHNADAWDKNRRVEFKIVKTEGKPTGVELGCPAAVKAGIVPPPVDGGGN